MVKCLFCEKTAITHNKQGIPTCKKHKNDSINVGICPLCNDFMTLKKGRYGVFVICDSCGSFSINKYVEML